jgi:hypothetical protein
MTIPSLVPRFSLALLVACCVQPGCSQVEPSVDGDSAAAKPWSRADDLLLPADFLDPPVHARPGSFWDWLNGSISEEQITRDLEEMKRGGMRGGEIWDVAAYADPDRRVPAGPEFLGPESTRLMVHAIREADRLGLEIGVVASSGWNAGGSWIPPEHAGKGLYHSTTQVTGPGKFDGNLPMPELPQNCPRDSDGDPVYLREVAVLAVPDLGSNTIADADQVLDLSSMVNADGSLHWDAPKGNWTVLRFVCANHGQQLIVPSPNSGGPMIDFFDPSATEFHLNHIVGTILKELGKETFEGTSFKTVEFDSMELDGFTPWNDSMADAFQRRVGYSVIRYLPLFAGWQLADQDLHQRFFYDWQKMVSDRLIDSHYTAGRKFLEGYGVKLIAESGGPGPPIWASNPVDGIKALGAVDIPRGEFWIRHRGIFLIKEIASAAHVYDKRLVDAEAFTTWRRWVDGPLNHKEIADRALCEGLNCFSFHTFASSPPEAGLPGWAYHAGTDINPTATWWPMARSLTDYLARCSYMLRQGWFVADICYYYGDQAPNFYPPLCNVPEHPLLDGLNPGYDYDVCSSQVIMERMRVENGRIVLPDGMSYSALVLPDQDDIPVAVLERVRDLVADGATVIAHQRPIRAPGLLDLERKAKAVDRLAGELWGQESLPRPKETHAQQAVSIRPLERGRFIVTSDRSEALRKIGVDEDFKIVGREGSDLGPLDFIHRRTTDDEFYFVRNKTRVAQSLICRFRVAAEANGMVPEFWWPQSGLRSECSNWRTDEKGYAELPFELAPLGSVFVVFRKANHEPDAPYNPLVTETIAAPLGLLATETIAPPLDSLATETFAAAPSAARRTLDGPWQVEFPEGWGAPQQTTFPKLQCWTESKDDGIRYFSGIATYKKSFEVPESLANQQRLFLQLGDLAEIAQVSLNSEELGLVWLPPYRIEITEAIQSGTNHLEIQVANLWANRLNGDSLLPESERYTRSNLDRMQTDPTSDSWFGATPAGETRPVYTDIPPLMKSGLLGPVEIITPSLQVPRSRDRK